MEEGDEGAEEGGSEDELDTAMEVDWVEVVALPPTEDTVGEPCTGDEGADIKSDTTRGRAQES